MPCDSHIHRKVITPGTKEGDPGSGKAMPYQSLPGVHPAFCKLSALLCSEANHDACWKQTVLYDIQNSLSLGCGKKKKKKQIRNSGEEIWAQVFHWNSCLEDMLKSERDLTPTLGGAKSPSQHLTSLRPLAKPKH